MKKLTLFSFLLILCTLVFAQKPKTVKVEATGEWVMSADMTLEQAKEKALFEAKKEALRMAEVQENIYSVSLLYLGSGDNQFTEIASELGKISIDGVVLVKEMNTELVSDKKSGINKMVVTIKAEVIKESQESDPEFLLDVKGIKSNPYKENENLSFSVIPYKDCFIRVFWFTSSFNGSGDMIFPYKDFYNDLPFETQKMYIFPLTDPKFVKTQMMDYTIYKEKQDVIEHNIILIVALKNQIPYTGEVTYQNVIHWLSRINRFDKVEIWVPITIVK